VEGSAFEPDDPFKWLANLWLEKVEIARKYKQSVFGEDADEITRLYSGSHDFIYDERYIKTSPGMRVTPGSDDETGLRPTFGMTVNKAAELVQIYGPVLYHRNPVRTVTPRQVPSDAIDSLASLDPALAQFVMQGASRTMGVRKIRAALMQAVLNYTPNELPGGGLKSHVRASIVEALLKGRGCLWTELYVSPSGASQIVGSFYDSVDNLLIDPDATSMLDAKWIARRHILPVWQAEDEYGLPRGSLKAHAESYDSLARSNTDYGAATKRRMGQTNDLVCLYEIFSKMGIGDQLAGSQTESEYRTQARQVMRDRFDQFGPFVRLVACKGCNYFLNIPPSSRSDDEEIGSRLAWPIPFYQDGEWPVSCIDFHLNPNIPWPISHLNFARGEMKCMDWVASFIMGKIRTTCRDFVAVIEAADEEIKRTIQYGSDLSILSLKGSTHKTISEMIQFLQHPPMNGDLLTVFNLAESLFEKRTGLTDLAYGMSPHQFRSAAESQLKGDATKARPDDMASKVEDWMTACARKEAMANRWLMKAEDIAPLLGQEFAVLWMQYVWSASIDEVVRELDYRVEAGSARKPNRDWEASTLDESAHVLLPALQQLWQMGNPLPFNAWISKWAQSRDMDPTPFLVGPPPPPPPPPPPQAPPPEAQQSLPPAAPPAAGPPPVAPPLLPQELEAMLAQQLAMNGGGLPTGMAPAPPVAMAPTGLPALPPGLEDIIMGGGIPPIL
jgi:hypothetical protein